MQAALHVLRTSSSPSEYRSRRPNSEIERPSERPGTRSVSRSRRTPRRWSHLAARKDRQVSCPGDARGRSEHLHIFPDRRGGSLVIDQS